MFNISYLNEYVLEISLKTNRWRVGVLLSWLRSTRLMETPVGFSRENHRERVVLFALGSGVIGRDILDQSLVKMLDRSVLMLIYRPIYYMTILTCGHRLINMKL